MRTLLLLFLSIALFSCATNYEKDKLYGTWVEASGKNVWTISFNEDESCEFRVNDNKLSINKYHLFGNAADFLFDNETVIRGITIKSLQGDSLILEERPGAGTVIHTLIRQ